MGWISALLEHFFASGRIRTLDFRNSIHPNSPFGEKVILCRQSHFYVFIFTAIVSPSLPSLALEIMLGEITRLSAPRVFSDTLPIENLQYSRGSVHASCLCHKVVVSARACDMCMSYGRHDSCSRSIAFQSTVHMTLLWL